MEFKQKMASVAGKYSLSCEFESLKFGYFRAVIYCDTYNAFNSARILMRRVDGMHVEEWCCFDGEFEGRLYIMDRNQKRELDKLLKEEQERIEDWWQRYHAADPIARSLMACGVIE